MTFQKSLARKSGRWGSAAGQGICMMSSTCFATIGSPPRPLFRISWHKNALTKELPHHELGTWKHTNPHWSKTGSPCWRINSLRRAQNGNILLYAVRAEDGQIRAYKIDQINDASVTSQVFVPRYQVELSPGASLAPIRQTAGAPSSLGVRGSGKRKPRQLRKVLSRRASNRSSGPIYIYRCPMCDKTFRRKSKNPRLNAHKTKDGWPCSGRTGYYQDTIY